jgi:hypothetical protein
LDKDKFKVVPVYGTVPNPLRQETQLQEANTFDLATLNLQQCVVNLKRHVDTKPSRFLFLRRRNNEKIKLETTKVNLLIEHIQSLIQLGRHVSDLKAEAILSGEVLRNLIDGKRIEFEHSLNIQLENNLREINAIHVDIKLNNLEVMTKEIEIELKRAEIRAMDASTTKDMAEAQALLAFIKHVETLPDELRTYAWTQYHRRDSSSSGFEEPQDIETKKKKRGYEQTYYEKEKDNVAYDSSKKKAEAEAFVAKMKKTKEIIEKKKKNE